MIENKRNIEFISSKIFDICYMADREIVGLSESDSFWWAKLNSIRHGVTIKKILEYAEKNKSKRPLKILNVSGIACGHQDFSIVDYLKNQCHLNIEWTVYDSPNNPYLQKEKFKKYLKDLGINLVLSDFRDPKKLYGGGNETYDIVISTEIIEHLDHSICLRAFLSIREKISDGGILILTTPNLVSLKNRLQFLLGRTKELYYGDGSTNIEKGLFGHIVLYDIYRLRRLLKDTGFKITSSRTFTDGLGPVGKKYWKILIFKLVLFLSFFFKDSKGRILIIAEKGDFEKIPFKI